MLTDRTKTLDPGHTIFDELATNGYRTGLFSGNSFLTQVDMGFNESFHTVESGREYRLPFPEAFDPIDISDGGNKYITFLAAALRNDYPLRSLFNGASELLPRFITDRFPKSIRPGSVPGDVYTDLFLKWATETNEPWAACVNYMDAHAPYLPKNRHDLWSDDDAIDPRECENPSWYYFDEDANRSTLTELKNYYDGCIHQIDGVVNRLIDELQQRDMYEDMLIIVTSDHGEGFGEPSDARSAPTMGHGISGGVAEEVLHVPLIVKYPEQNEGRTVTEPASLTRFPAVVREMLDNNSQPNGFVPEGPVISYMDGMLPIVRPAANPYVDDLSEFKPAVRVCYERTADNVTKYVLRDNEAFRINCLSAQKTTSADKIDSDLVRKKYPNLTSSGILSEENNRQLSANVENRLNDLGYV
jgi:arylsulfatase